MSVRLLQGDCLRAMRLMARLGIMVDAIVCDPPYHLTSIVKRFGADDAAPTKAGDAYKRLATGFMGQRWDGGDIAFRPETWALAMAVLKPGGMLLAFGGTRGAHRMACAIEDAGFEIRDTIMWLYGSGFPKSHSVALALESSLCKRVGDEWFYRDDGAAMATEPPFRHPGANHWPGWGTALKPAYEPVVVARKPLSESSVAANVLRHGTGAINVGACKIGEREARALNRNGSIGYGGSAPQGTVIDGGEGRWPANVVHDGSEEVEAAFAAFGEGKSPASYIRNHDASGGILGKSKPAGYEMPGHGDTGTASRFFYSAKAGPDDRLGSKHPTVKPVALMRWLVRLVCPPGSLVLDPFAGSGSTGIAARAEGVNAVLIEADPGYAADIRTRLAHSEGKAAHTANVKQRHADPDNAGAQGTPLFSEAAE